MRPSSALGRHGEDLAARHLEQAGMTIVDRNWRCRAGEIDIVAADGTTLVFCEVKTRRGTAFGAPACAVTPVKLARMRRLAGLWLAAHSHAPESIRLDVVAIVLPRGAPAEVDHFRGVSS